MPVPDIHTLMAAQVALEAAITDKEAAAAHRNRLLCAAYAAGMGQAELARALGISQPTIVGVIARTQEDLIAFKVAPGNPAKTKAAKRRRRSIIRRRNEARRRTAEEENHANAPG